MCFSWRRGFKKSFGKLWSIFFSSLKIAPPFSLATWLHWKQETFPFSPLPPLQKKAILLHRSWTSSLPLFLVTDCIPGKMSGVAGEEEQEEEERSGECWQSRVVEGHQMKDFFSNALSFSTDIVRSVYYLLRRESRESKKSHLKISLIFMVCVGVDDQWAAHNDAIHYYFVVFVIFAALLLLYLHFCEITFCKQHLWSNNVWNKQDGEEIIRASLLVQGSIIVALHLLSKWKKEVSSSSSCCTLIFGEEAVTFSHVKKVCFFFPLFFSLSKLDPKQIALASTACRLHARHLVWHKMQFLC